ncbi:hypothetical protein QTP86_021989 [Hemibagrus guttatus]|nr:hypothetical protein QTP86_021989 [Hemibagrus guttatus]
MDTRYNGVHVYDRQTLLVLGNHAPANVHDELRKSHRGLGLLRRPDPESSASPNAGGRPALPSILLSNVCYLDNKLDYIRLQLTTQREYRDCGVFVFTETWLSNRVPDTAIQLDGLTAFCADRNAALCAYRPLIRCSKPVLKLVKTWPEGAISALQDCFDCTDWDMFRKAATKGDTTDLQEYTSSVTSYISKCIDDVTISKSITTRSNQKPWLTAKVCVLLKSRDSAFRAGDKDALRTARAKLSRAIREANRTHSQGIHGHFQSSGDTRRMCQGIQSITNYRPAPPACDSNASLPDALLCSRRCPNVPKDHHHHLVPKKSPVSCLNDYCPLALTPIIMKCFERLVMRQIKDLLPPDPMQFAFHPNRSTDDAISTTLHKSLTHLENKNTYVGILFIDFSSAFNTIIPQHLTEKLSLLGINISLCN